MMDDDHENLILNSLLYEEELDWDFMNINLLDTATPKSTIRNIIFHKTPDALITVLKRTKDSAVDDKDKETQHVLHNMMKEATENIDPFSDSDEIDDAKFHEEVDLDSDGNAVAVNNSDNTIADEDVIFLTDDENENEEQLIHNDKSRPGKQSEVKLKTIIKTMADIRKDFNIRFTDDILTEEGSYTTKEVLWNENKVVVIKNNGIIIQDKTIREVIQLDDELEEQKDKDQAADKGAVQHLRSENNISQKEAPTQNGNSIRQVIEVVEILSDEEATRPHEEPHYPKNDAVTETRNQKYMCEKCGHFFLLSSSLKRHHIKQHSKGTTFQCEICDKTFLSKGELQVHISLVHCGEEISSKKLRKVRRKVPLVEPCESLQSYDENRNNFVCHVCRNGFRGEHRGRPSQSDTGTGNVVCIMCGRRYLTLGLLKQLVHKRTMDRGVDGNCKMYDKSEKPRKRYCCPVCNKVFVQGSAFSKHRRKHEAFYEKRLSFKRECKRAKDPQVASTNYDKQDWSRERGRLYCCKICKKEFKYSKELMLHISVHSKP